MVIHNRNHHDGDNNLNFRLEAIKTFVGPIDRQFDEALRMKHSEANIILNSGAKWRLYAIPRAHFTAPKLERRRSAWR